MKPAAGRRSRSSEYSTRLTDFGDPYDLTSTLRPKWRLCTNDFSKKYNGWTSWEIAQCIHIPKRLNSTDCSDPTAFHVVIVSLLSSSFVAF